MHPESNCGPAPMLRSLLLLAVCLCALSGVCRAALPPNFMYGTATASYQIEGAWNVDGKQPGEWDMWSHLPGNVANGDNGDVAAMGYERALEDVQLLQDMGVTSYRFSISWPRIITASGAVNPLGLAHYSRLVDALLAAHITPLVTLYHWDMPLQYSTLMNNEGLGFDARGWLNSSYIVPLFTRYASVVFEALGDRVAHWVVFNEPHTFCVGGFANYGALAPGRCSDRTACQFGDSTREPYQCAHSVLLAWSAVANLYRRDFAHREGYQRGAQLGFSLDSGWAEPYNSSSPADIAAAERSMEFTLAWWGDVLFTPGHDYPPSMRRLVGERLPRFTKQERREMEGAIPDFFGFNHYTSFYSFEELNSTDPFLRDQQAGSTRVSLSGELIGPQAASEWLYVVPWGFPKALQWIARRYPGVPIIVTENGVDVPEESDTPLPDVLHDQYRIDYLSAYLSNMTAVAVEQMGVPVVGYFVWSFMDNLEWADGYSCRFGLNYVDFKDSAKRYAKDSVAWYANWIQQQKEETAAAHAKATRVKGEEHTTTTTTKTHKKKRTGTKRSHGKQGKTRK